MLSTTLTSFLFVQPMKLRVFELGGFTKGLEDF